MTTFTETQVKQVVVLSMEGFLDWIKKETIIVNTKTGEEIVNAEITTKKKSKSISFYVNKKFNENGITTNF